MSNERFELRFGSDGNRELVDASNGGSQPSEGGVYFLTASAPANNSTPYSWAFGYATPQLDLTDPHHPAALVEGVYALTVTVLGPTVFTPGTLVAPGIDIDTENNDAGTTFGGPLTLFAGAIIPMTGTCTFHSPAGATMLAQINHDDAGSGTLDFTATAFVQRVA